MESTRPLLLQTPQLTKHRPWTIPTAFCDLAFHCGDLVFHVNREVIAEASSVWRAMVKGPFAESRKDVVHLGEDDPGALKLALDVVYIGIL